jgi:hypothetical protein
MAVAKQPPEIALLLSTLDRAFDRTSWHGPNLRSSVRGLTSRTAAWRPGPRRKCIAEIVLHAAYWKYAARRRLLGGRRGAFPRKGSNWFALDEPFTAARWRDGLALLDAEHAALREAIASFPASRLNRRLGRGELTAAMLIEGVAAHDVYHAGQIQLLRRMQRSSTRR